MSADTRPLLSGWLSLKRVHSHIISINTWGVADKWYNRIPLAVLPDFSICVFKDCSNWLITSSTPIKFILLGCLKISLCPMKGSPHSTKSFISTTSPFYKQCPMLTFTVYFYLVILVLNQQAWDPHSVSISTYSLSVFFFASCFARHAAAFFQSL